MVFVVGNTDGLKLGDFVGFDVIFMVKVGFDVG